MRAYLPLIQKDSVAHMYGLAVYVNEGLPFACELPLKNSEYSYLCSRLNLLHSVSCFLLYPSQYSSLCKVFCAVSCNIDMVPLPPIQGSSPFSKIYLPLKGCCLE